MIKSVLLDGTLLDRDTSIEQFIWAQYDRLIDRLSHIPKSDYTTRFIGLGIQDYFDIMLISEVEQVRKPQPEIFQRALDRLGVAATDSVFVGDNPTADILGANSVKMRTIWKRNSHWLEPKAADVVIDELSEIPLILPQFDIQARSIDPHSR